MGEKLFRITARPEPAPREAGAARVRAVGKICEAMTM